MLSTLVYGTKYAVTSSVGEDGRVVHRHRGSPFSPFDRYVGEEFGKAIIETEGVRNIEIEFRQGGISGLIRTVFG